MRSSAETELNEVLRHYDVGKLQKAKRLEQGYVNENWIIDTSHARLSWPSY
jgi:hypothetical protein